MRDQTSRRATLVAVGTSFLVGLAGCGGSPAESNVTTSTTGDDESAADGDTATADATTATGGDDLDLREANVVGVAVERRDGAYRFEVTLYHDDDGEDGYANWWQVETRDGEQLGRRDLLHAHGTREFTRSATVDVSDGVTEVVVRGHDQSHGYGGQAMLVDLETGTATAVRQGTEPRSFAES